MMYQDRLAVALKSNGKILREFKDTVYVPFGSEFSIFIKNMNTVRALVSITIDGQDIADGDTFVVGANSTLDIERYLKSGNLKEGNRFKFIERTSRIEQHRGAQIEDGLVRIEFEFERQMQVWTNNLNNTLFRSNDLIGKQYYAQPQWATGTPPDFNNRDIWCSAAIASGEAQSINVASATSVSIPKVDAVANDVGITVPGSISGQQFQSVSTFTTDGVKHVMVLKMLGELGQQPVTAPVTVKHKPKCVTCGKQNKATAKFCSECGTALEIV